MNWGPAINTGLLHGLLSSCPEWGISCFATSCLIFSDQSHCSYAVPLFWWFWNHPTPALSKHVMPQLTLPLSKRWTDILVHTSTTNCTVYQQVNWRTIPHINQTFNEIFRFWSVSGQRPTPKPMPCCNIRTLPVWCPTVDLLTKTLFLTTKFCSSDSNIPTLHLPCILHLKPNHFSF